MPCFYPLKGWRDLESGGITFSPKEGFFPMDISCGKCIGCRQKKRREWQIRMYHEAQWHLSKGLGTAFVTLTYDDSNLPIGVEDEFYDLEPAPNGPRPSLRMRHVSEFLKRLQRAVEYHYGEKVRYYVAGEYGEQTGRPHYHAALFGCSFPDREPLSVRGKSKKPLYRSKLLDRCWKHGYASIGTDSDYKAFSYVAKYITKGPSRYDPFLVRGYNDQEPMGTVKSRGLGFEWLRENWSDVYPSDHVIMGGREWPVPRAYDRKMEEWQPELMDEVARARKMRSKDYYRGLVEECEQNPWRMEQKREYLELNSKAHQDAF